VFGLLYSGVLRGARLTYQYRLYSGIATRRGVASGANASPAGPTGQGELRAR